MRHFPAPGNRLPLEVIDRYHRIDQPHLESFLGRVMTAEKPEFLGPLDADVSGKQTRAEAAVEAANPRAGLAEPGVVGSDRHVADQVKDVPAANRIAGDHGNHGLGGATDLNVKVAHVKPPDTLLGDVVVPDISIVAANPLVATGTECLGAGAGEDDRPDLYVVARLFEGVTQLGQTLGPEGIANLGPVDRDLGDTLGLLVEDVRVISG